MPVIDLDDAVLDLDPLVSLAQLKTRYDVVDDSRAELALQDASDLVRSISHPKVWADPSTAPKSIKVIVIRAVERYLNNPDGLQAESYGSYSYSYSKDFSVGMWLTDGETKMIERLSSRRGITSLQIYSPYEGSGSNTIYAQPYNDPDPMPVWDATYPF